MYQFTRAADSQWQELKELVHSSISSSDSAEVGTKSLMDGAKKSFQPIPIVAPPGSHSTVTSVPEDSVLPAEQATLFSVQDLTNKILSLETSLSSLAKKQTADGASQSAAHRELAKVSIVSSHRHAHLRILVVCCIAGGRRADSHKTRCICFERSQFEAGSCHHRNECQTTRLL